jgi:sugar lactone lactonase YvrE
VVADSNGNVFIADTFNHRVRRVGTDGFITTIAGTGNIGYNGDNIPATTANLYYPIGLAVDAANNLYIADENNNRIRKVDTSGIITTVAGNGVWGYNGENLPATSANLRFPQGVALDSQGNLYIAEERDRVRKVNTSGIIATLTGTGEPGYNGDNIVPSLAQLSFPISVTLDTQGNIFIADSENFLVRVIFAVSTGSMTLTLTTP